MEERELPWEGSEIFLHFVLVVRYADALIPAEQERRIHLFIKDLLEEMGQEVVGIGGMPDHLHLLLESSGDVSITDLVEECKEVSARFIREKELAPTSFEWKEGFAAFSFSREELGRLVPFVESQKEYHREHSFKEEFIAILQENKVSYDNDELDQWVLPE